MFAILSKLVPIRDWIYLGVFVALIGSFAYYTHHERAVGAQQIVAADTRAAQKQATAVAKVESSAKVEVQNATQAYAAAISAAAHVPAPHIVCYGPEAGSGSVLSHAGASSSGHGSSAVPAESSVPFDPAPAVVNDARDADAQIALLQAYIAACQRAGICKE